MTLKIEVATYSALSSLAGLFPENKKPVPKGTDSFARGATLFGPSGENPEDPEARKKLTAVRAKSQAVTQPASHSAGTGFLVRNPIPPPVNGGEPAQATVAFSKFALRLPGPFNALVRTGLPPHPSSLGLRLSTYYFPITAFSCI